jgi:hypothetical protein
MKPTMAVTLMSANQYSKVPKFFTERELTKTRIRANARDHIHAGMPGYQ